ncbi:BACON domain-containing protein [Carbonactinospora thermoautotrophica]|nr:sigma factor [Carbonactinospora thermoautotrophica]
MKDITPLAGTVVGDAWGREAAYDAYADGLHTYCLSLLQDHDVAADALYDTFVVADHHIVELRASDRLKPWLYALARNECLRRLRGEVTSSHNLNRAHAEEAVADLERNLRRAELHSLLWPEAQGLDPQAREALELSVRHGLAGPDLAKVLGITPEYAHALLSRAWQEVELTRAVLTVVNAGDVQCRERNRLVGSWDGDLTAQVRKRFKRHLQRCAACETVARGAAGASMLPGMLPLVAAPRALRDRILGDLGAGRRQRKHLEIARRAAHFDAEGFPVPYDRKSGFGRSWRRPAVAAVVVLAASASCLIAWKTNSTEPVTVLAGPQVRAPYHPGADDRRQSPEPPAQADPTAHPTVTPTLTVAPSLTAPKTAAANNRSTLEQPTPARPSRSRPATPGKSGPQPTPSQSTPTPAPGELRLSQQQVDLGDGDQATVTLRNTGGSPVSWRAEYPADLLSVSPASGTLQPGQEQTITITIHNRPAENWQTQITFLPGQLVLTVTGNGTSTPGG